MPRPVTVHVAPTVTLFHTAATESPLRVISFADKLGPTERLCGRCRAGLHPDIVAAIGGADAK